jgi:serine/threonine protein kinase
MKLFNSPKPQLIDVVQGLEYLHSYGVVHQNLKPVSHALCFAAHDAVLMRLVKQNVLVNTAGRACLSDIGFTTPARDEELDTGDTESSVHYSRWRAPEVVKDNRFSEQSDIFSFGFVAAEVRFQKPYVLQPQSTMHRYSQERYCGERPARRKLSPRFFMANDHVCPKERRNLA